MLDTPNFNSAQLDRLRRFFHAMNHFMVFLWKIGLARMMNAWPSVGGCIMVIFHRGRKSGKQYLTPVNYAVLDGAVYCMAGFGRGTDWYRNVMANPDVQLWLPEGKRRAHACDVSERADRASLIRAIAIASGFAGPLLGFDQRKMTDEQILAASKDYRIIHFALEPSNAV